MEVFEQTPDTFDSSGWTNEGSSESKRDQSSFENVEHFENIEYISYDEIGPDDADLMSGELESEAGLIKNIFTYEDDDNEIHVDYIDAYDESQSPPDLHKKAAATDPQGGEDKESLVPEKSKIRNPFKNDRETGKGKVVKIPHKLISSKMKKKTEASSSSTGLRTKTDSTETLHKKRLKKFHKGLLRQLFQVSPGSTQSDKRSGRGNPVHQVATLVADLTDFAASYNKLTSVLRRSP